jgi:hypothetical protein
MAASWSRAMRIESIRIKGFGRLVDRVFELPRDRAALVIADNEHGKSTLAAAILAGLCGFPRNTRAAKPKDLWRPWTGDEYGLTMQIEAAGRQLNIERDFARDKFVVRETATNRDVSSEFDEDMAATILKLPRDDFSRIALILGKEVHRFDSSVSLKSRLAELVEGSNDTNAEAAIAAIEGARYTLGDRSIKIDTAIQRLTDARDRARLEMSRLDAGMDACERDSRELESVQQRQADLTDRLKQLDSEYRAACLAEVRGRLESARRDLEAVGALRAELEGLADYAAFPAARWEQLTSAAARNGELTARLQETGRRREAAMTDASRLQAAIDQNPSFASATEQDVSGLGGCIDAMRDAAAKTEGLRAEYAALRSVSASPAWAAVSAVGFLGALACISLMIMHRMELVQSAVGTGISILISALGMTFLTRGGRQRSELKARLEQAQVFYESAADRAKRQLAFLGVPVEDEPTLETLQRTQDALSRLLADRKRAADLQADAASLEREAHDCRRKIAEEESAIKSILREAGIDPALEIDESRRRFQEGVERWRRYREVRESLLPALEARLLPLDEISSLEEQESRLSAEADPDASPRPAAQVEADRQSVRSELDAASQRLRELENRIGTLVDNYRSRYPALQEEASRLDSEVARARRFGQALEAAAGVLREVAQSTRRRWATALNERAAIILPCLNPDYDTLLFDDDLGFTVRRVVDNRVIEKSVVDSALSTGAKDQIYLALRLACAAELSFDESLPVILDDPFIAFDDTRFASALRYVVDQVARRQQVIMLTCHDSWYRNLLRDEQFQGNVEVIAL